MPEQIATTQPETPGQKTMRRFYEGRLAERLMLASDLHEGRALMRRGARKQQDGTLGEPGDAATAEEQMAIRIGDEIHYHQTAAAGTMAATPPTATTVAQPSAPAGSAPAPASALSAIAKAAIVGASLLGTGGIGTSFYALLKPTAAAEPPQVQQVAPPVLWPGIEIRSPTEPQP